ncbi:MAG: sigma 54-interacting transcriptional regulator [Nitrospirae bacterium]|nr:sigma 54-interacting transcriptional regulator [Nitrospirota bacterium]
MKQNESEGLLLDAVDVSDVINGIPHGVALIDKDLRIFRMNRILEVMTGYSTNEVQGIQCNYALRTDCDELLNKALNNGGGPLILEGSVIDANRKKVSVRITASPLKGRESADDNLLLVIEDISMLKEMDIKLQGSPEKKALLGNSSKLQEIIELLPVFAYTDATLLITGETGTGKDLLAEAIHKSSKRAKYPFIKVNCGAIPETLLESELFGHVRGAFTGANADKPGMFRLAQGGTLFLTEIGDLPLQLQVKLLTVLDDKEFYPLGSSKKIKADIRLITGTHRDLRQLLDEGKFREDLYYRLNVLRAHMPALRERGDDVLLLMNHFLKEFNNNLGKKIKGFASSSIDYLLRYEYPGNVRELRNIIEHAVNICQGTIIQMGHLPSYILSPGEDRKNTEQLSEAIDEPTVIGASKKKFASWAEIEKSRILETMMETGGNRSEAALKLGWSRSTLWRKIKHYGLE